MKDESGRAQDLQSIMLIRGALTDAYFLLSEALIRKPENPALLMRATN
jgi:hypothetical protein